ncbi:tyrosine-type recombinase/integrase [Ensifer aridi]|uniref:tyrosine-type recombinase/integrase n=1 Tax=Ensifer aridi TaxID=1708715 RepID=UPI000A10F52F|nr:tyrosine-type recombinase/integrase [Ensifer aridi]
MAELFYPKTVREYGRAFQRIPYLLSKHGEYIEGVNHYMQERLSGRLSHDGTEKIVFSEPSDDLIKAVSYNLLDAMNWVECEEAHPLQPDLHWSEARPWHFKYLYPTSMLAGYWSQEFWASGNPTPLTPSRTIKPRVREITTCYKFMAKHGLIGVWENGDDPPEMWGAAWAAAERAFIDCRPYNMRGTQERVYNKRKSPAKQTPPEPKHLKVFFNCFDDEAPFRGARLIFTTGMRIEEVSTQTLVPGTTHQRSDEEVRSGLLFPNGPYLLRYDPRNDAMIGVMPSIDVAFGDEEQACEYRIVGKGPKVRSVPVPHSEMRALWKYRDRISPIDRHGPSAFLLNSKGRPLSNWSLSTAIRVASLRASTIVGTQLNLTAHALRHAFACRFIEAAIIGQAENAGLKIEDLTPDQIDKFGRGPILTLQDILGHEWTETTELYLRQLKRGMLGFQYTKMFNQQLDDGEWDSGYAK